MENTILYFYIHNSNSYFAHWIHIFNSPSQVIWTKRRIAQHCNQTFKIAQNMKIEVW